MTPNARKSRLALRGIEVRDDAAHARMLPWTKLAFGLGGVQACIATTFGLPDMLWQMVPVALLAVILPHHPVEYVYNHAIRHVTGTIPLPPNRAPVRFAFFMAALTLAAAAASFEAGLLWLGFLLGTAVVMLSATFVLTSFCVPAAIWAVLTGNRAGVVCALRPA